MFTFFCRSIILFTLAFSFLTSPKVSALSQENYLEGLFKEVEAREKNPETQPARIYDTLIKDSLSFKLLNKYPKLMIGKIRFSPHVPKDLEGREADVQKGQDLILKVLLTPAMLNNPVTFKDLIQQIDLNFQNSQSSLRYSDWIIIASAFRTLSAPDSETTPNALGIFVTEYILLMLINDLETKPNRTKEENELLSTLYYILSQIYQNIINNPDEYSFIKKKGKKSSPLYLSLPKIYYEDSYYEDTYIEPITHSTISEYDIPYDDPYFYSIFISFDVTYDILVIQRLYLLRTAVIVTPYYDVAWIPIIRYIAVDLRSPFYVERLTPVFWNNYFPLGIVGVEPIYIDKVYNRWEKITANPRAISQIQNPKIITNSLRELKNPEWRKEQEKKVEQKFQEKLKESQLEEGKKERSLQEKQERLRHEERREEQRLQQERKEQLPLERKQERLRREERREEQRLQQERQGQLPPEREQERLRHEERKEERRLQQERQGQLPPEREQERLRREERREERRLQQERQEQLPLEREQERLRREERREEQRLQQERKEQLPLEREQEQIRREEGQKKQIIEQKIEGLKSEERRETPPPTQEMKIPHMEPQKPTIERQGPPNQGNPIQGNPNQGPSNQGNPKKSK